MSDPVTRLSSALEGRYTIERELGMGGMAVVYLAHDVRHDRKVALKVLRAELAAILGGERFLKEIRTTANLQHPHILPLHDSGEADGIVYYVMPFVEGESLRDRLTKEKQLPVDDAVRIAREVADALQYAHQHGVVHRDIKPENILLHGGHAQVADFGIALAVSTAGAGTRMTETGMSLGTPHYMAPEQAMGEREITPKADIYALGCVLYEMLTGEPPFTGPTAQAIVARVMTEQPRSLTMQRRTIPPHVEAAVSQALEKLPADRFGSAAAFAEALGNAAFTATLRGSTAAMVPYATATGMPRWRAAASPGVWALLAVAVGLGLWGSLRARPHVPAPVARFDLSFDRGAEAADGTGSPIAISPDGSRIVYLGRDSSGVFWLFLRGLDRLEPIQIAGTRQADQPFFSPDGQWIGFRQDGKIKKVSLAGGAVVTICEAPTLFGASWGPGDAIVFSSRSALYRVAAAGGQPERLVAQDSGSVGYRFPHQMPDGRNVLFTRAATGSPTLSVLSVGDRKVRSLNQPGMSPFFVEGGFLVFAQSDGTLFAAPFDARRAVMLGPPQPITDNVREGPAMVAKIGIARTGALAYLSGSAALRNLVMVNRAGLVEQLSAPPARYRQPRLSPDGRRVAVGIDQPTSTSGDVWVYDIGAGSSARLTYDSTSIYPVWMPDGRYVAYSHLTSTTTVALFRIVADGSGRPETLLVRPSPVLEVEFTPNGRQMVFREIDANTHRDVWITSVDSPAAARPLLRTPFEERGIALTPDGKWLAYTSNETGTDEIYVRSLAEGSARWRVSTNGGTEPRWARGGRELYYRTADSVFMVPIAAGAAFQHGQPKALFGGRFSGGGGNNVAYDVSRDGNRFVFVRSQTASEGGEEVHVLLNWFDQLRAPAKGAGAR